MRKMKVSVKQVYTSVSCNRVPEIADWNEAGFICYGACNSVVVYDTNQKGKDPLTIRSYHLSSVNSVKWLHKPDGACTEFISCSADKTAAIWSLVGEEYQVTSALNGHEEGVTCVHGTYTNGDDLVVYTGSIDSTVKIWERINGITNLKQTINLQSGLCLTLHAHLLPSINKPILFCALDDYKVHVFMGDEYHRVHMLVGHEDWVRGLDVLDVDETTILLASASQDTYIRLWRIQQHIETQTTGIKVEETVFNGHGKKWAVKLDAVLAGHEGWVYGVQWQPQFQDSNKRVPIYRLLSSSLDKTVIVWEPDETGAWTERVRVGEVGGNGLGFYGARWGPNGRAFVAQGYNGSFHVWRLDEETRQWAPSVVAGGHYSSVEDLRWEGGGRYIVSVSTDQTSRVHAPWIRDGLDPEWHEIARPQVHGFDMASIAIVSPTTYVSAAEEKVLRVFRASHNFVANFGRIVGLELEGGEGAPEGASVPSLGLSNKAVFTENDTSKMDENDGYFVPITLNAPPTEETLMQNTLWPEVQKLYGHGYEVYALDASADGALVASACKATVSEHAALLLWETKTWKMIQKLVSHTLTVTQIAFSPDSARLLSVSRDRKWTLYQRTKSDDLFDKVASTDKSNGVHSRIIWCCAWAHDGAIFATGSREGKVCLWSETGTTTNTSLGSYALHSKPLELTSSVTALAFAPVLLDGARLIATGLENGLVNLFAFGDGWSLLYELDNSAAHHLTVKRLAFKPKVEDTKEVLLASCGSDHLVRIHSITFSF